MSTIPLIVGGGALAYLWSRGNDRVRIAPEPSTPNRRRRPDAARAAGSLGVAGREAGASAGR